MDFSHKRNDKIDIGYLAWPFLGLLATILIGLVILEVRGVAADDRSDAYVPSQQSFAITLQPVTVKNDDSSQWVGRALARPLFSSDRRPPSDTTILVAGAPASLPRLTGVVVSSMGAYAIFDEIDSGKPVVVVEGGQVGAAIVESIAPGQVIVRVAGDTVVLHPAFDEKPLQVQVTMLDPAEPVMAGYQRHQDGHHAAFWKAVATANRSGSNQ